MQIWTFFIIIAIALALSLKLFVLYHATSFFRGEFITVIMS